MIADRKARHHRIPIFGCQVTVGSNGRIIDVMALSVFVSKNSQVANRIAGSRIFERCLSEKSENTLKRHGRDLELFAEYFLDAGVR
jgi:hypothetical protein